MEFVETHLNSPVSAYIMMFNTNDYNVDFKKLNKIFMGFGPLVKSSYYYKKIKAEFNGIKLIQPGKQAPDFTLNTPDNKPLTLSSLKGKYLLLDFWASWCQPCRQSFPQMKDIYKKYHDKGVEFLGISDDSKLDAWKKALADDQLPWLQVVDEFPEKYKPARVGTLYSVHYIPSTILLDKTGKIIAKNLHGDELEKMLNELLNK